MTLRYVWKDNVTHKRGLVIGIASVFLVVMFLRSVLRCVSILYSGVCLCVRVCMCLCVSVSVCVCVFHFASFVFCVCIVRGFGRRYLFLRIDIHRISTCRGEPTLSFPCVSPCMRLCVRMCG